MILDHCVSLLENGTSSFRQSSFNDAEQVLSNLQSGVRARKLNGVKTGLLMLEMMKVSNGGLTSEAKIQRFDRFVNYLFSHLSEPVAMAMVKYALADRRLSVPTLQKSSAMARIKSIFSPILLDNSKDPKEVRKNSRFMRIYGKLQSQHSFSDRISSMLRDAGLTTLTSP